MVSREGTPARCIVETTSAFDETEKNNGSISESRFHSPELGSDIAETLRVKERRPKSIALIMVEAGDRLKLKEHPKITTLLAKNGESCVYFSHTIAKINRQNKIQERLIVISDGAVYNIHKDSYKVKRRIPISSISHISTSRLRDNIFVLHVPTEYDYVYVSEDKMEIMTLIQKIHHQATHQEMPLFVDNVITFCTDRAQVRKMEFIDSPDGVFIQVYGRKAK